MAEKPWKVHEKVTAKFFNTRRAIHGVDRGTGRVDTDVFVDVEEWISEPDITFHPQVRTSCIVVECKYISKTAGRSGDWPIRRLHEMWKETPKPAGRERPAPLIITQDRWVLCRLDDFVDIWLDFYSGIYRPGKGMTMLYNYSIRHVKQTMSKFMVSAIEQAYGATLPAIDSLGRSKTYERVMHAVCLGSNARMSKVLCIPDPVIYRDKLEEEKPSP